MQIFLEGAIQYREYEKDSETHYITEIIGSSFQFLDKKKEEAEAVTKLKPPVSPAPAPGASDWERDIPF